MLVCTYDPLCRLSNVFNLALSKIIPAPLPNSPGRGILSVILHEGSGLSAPEPHRGEFNLQLEASQGQGGKSYLKNSYPGSQKRYLPHAILCFDKSHVLAGSVAGTTENPQWDGEARPWRFDVLRHSQVRVCLYLKNPNTASETRDIPLGMVTIDPPFQEGGRTSIAKWFDVQEGTGRVQIQIEYIKSNSAEMGNMWHSYFHENGQPGTVPATRKDDTQQLYAYKMISIHEESDDLFTLKQNLRFQIDSPFIASLKFASQSNSTLYLFSPFITGGHLFYHLQKDRHFDLDRSRFYAAEIVCALSHLHDLGIVYHELSPKSVILDSWGHISLVCRGLYLPNMKEGEHKRKVGAPSRLLPPEVLLGCAHSKTSDWWTLGVFLYEMLTGLPPFYDEDVDRIHRKILSEPLQPQKSLSPCAQDFLLKILERRPEQRLGAKGASEIKAHPFFDSLDWEKVARREYEPTFRSPHPATLIVELAERSFSEQMKDFLHWDYNTPTDPPNSKRVTLEQRLAKPTDPGESSVVSDRHPVAGSATAAPIAKTLPRTSESSTLAVSKSHDWILIWESKAREFYLCDSLTNEQRQIKPRKTGEPPRMVQASQASYAAQGDAATTSQNLSGLASGFGGYNVPTQEQKEGVLEEALRAGYPEVITQLLEKHSMDLDIQILDAVRTPIEVATMQKDLNLVKLLLEHGADPSFSVLGVGHGASLVFAAEMGNTELVEILLQDTTRLPRTKALGVAVDRQDFAMVTLLLSKGAECDFKETDRPQPRRADQECCFVEEISSPSPFIPPLVRAVKLGNLKLVKLLLAHGADPNAGFHDFPSLSLPGPSIEEWSRPVIRCGTVIQLAAYLGHQDLVRLLLDAGADISLPWPVWRYHECMMIPRERYFKITLSLRMAEIAAAKQAN